MKEKEIDETPDVICDKSITMWPAQASDVNEIRTGEWWDDLAELNPEAVIFDGPGPQTLFDSCIIGYASRPGMDTVIVYDVDLMIELLSATMGLEDAVDYLCTNTFSAYLGVGTPMILRRYEDGAGA